MSERDALAAACRRTPRSAGVLDAAGQPTKPGRCRRPTAPAGRPWCAGRRRTVAAVTSRTALQEPAHPVGRRPGRSATTPGYAPHLRRGHRVRRVVRPARASAPSAQSDGRPGPRRWRRRSRSAGAGAGRAWPASGAPARSRTRPGWRRSASRQVVTAASSVVGPGGDVAQQQVGVAGQRLGARWRPTRSAPRSSGRCPSGVAVVLSTATQRAGRVRAAATARRCRTTSRPGLAGVSSSTSRTPSNDGYGPTVGTIDERDAQLGQRRVGRTRGRCSSRRTAAPRVSPGRSTASSAAVMAA